MQIVCPHCQHELTEIEIRSLNGKLNVSKRIAKRGGKRKILNQSASPKPWSLPTLKPIRGGICHHGRLAQECLACERERKA